MKRTKENSNCCQVKVRHHRKIRIRLNNLIPVCVGARHRINGSMVKLHRFVEMDLT